MFSPLHCPTTKTAKLYRRFSPALVLIHSAWLPCFWCHESDTHPLPICYNSHWIPIYLSKWNQLKACCAPGAQSWRVCIKFMKWLAEVIGERDWSKAPLKIIIITLKDLHWLRHGSHSGLLAINGHRAPSMGHFSNCRDRRDFRC